MFEHLDYVYLPSRDVAADVTYFTEVLGGSLVFATPVEGRPLTDAEIAG